MRVLGFLPVTDIAAGFELAILLLWLAVLLQALCCHAANHSPVSVAEHTRLTLYHLETVGPEDSRWQWTAESRTGCVWAPGVEVPSTSDDDLLSVLLFPWPPSVPCCWLNCLSVLGFDVPEDNEVG